MKRFVLILTSCLLALGAFALVLYLSDSTLKEFLTGVGEAGWGALLSLCLFEALILAVQAWSWRFLIPRHGGRTPFRILYPSILIGWAMNFLTPSMYLGGEPLRAVYVAHRAGLRRRAVLASVIVHKYLELTSFLVFLLSSTAILVGAHACELAPGVLITVLGLNGALVLLCLVLYLSVLRRWGLIVRIGDGLARVGIARKWLGRHRRKILEIECHVHRAFFHHRRRTFLSLGGMFLFTLLIYLRPIVFFIFVEEGWPFGLAELAVLFCLIQLLQALQFTPGGLGILEGGIPAIFLLVSVRPPVALAFIAFLRIADLVLVALGFAFLTHHGLSASVLCRNPAAGHASKGPHAPSER